jgi:hypothetical protein
MLSFFIGLRLAFRRRRAQAGRALDAPQAVDRADDFSAPSSAGLDAA